MNRVISKLPLKKGSIAKAMYDCVPVTFTPITSIRETARERGIAHDSVAGAMTRLRRAGVLEYKKVSGGDMKWRRHPQSTPITPQADLRHVASSPNRPNGGQHTQHPLPTVQTHLTTEQVIDSMVDMLIALKESHQQEIKAAQEQCLQNLQQYINKYKGGSNV